MPPVRRPRAPQAQSARCRFVDEQEQRCRRVATVGGGLCRQHALLLELQITGIPQASLDEIIGTADRAASRHQHNPFVAVVTGALNGVLGGLFMRDQARARAGQPPGSGLPRQPPRAPQPQPRTPPSPPPPDPMIRAREIMGFEPQEKLTAEKVQKRKQALARVFHPDMQGGSEAQMKRVNQAADLLLAKLS